MKKSYSIVMLLVLAIAAVLTVGCVNNSGLSGAYVDVKSHTACLDFSSDGTYVISNIQSNTGWPATYQIKNSQILLSVPLNSMMGIGSNNVLVTCNLNGNILDCGQEWGVFQKEDSCDSVVTG